MKRALIFAATLASTTLAGGTQLVANSGFENLPFPTSWTSSGTASIAGLNSTTTAAKLPYNTNASLSQTLGSTVANFTAELSFQVAGIDTVQAFHCMLDTSSGTAIDIRTTTGGVIQLKDASVWKPLYRISDNSTFAVAINQTFKLRVVGRNFGSGSASYDIAWSNPASTTLSHAATNLTAFSSNTTLTSTLSLIRFNHDVTLGNSFTVDDVTLLDSSSTSPTADYSLTPPPPPAADKILKISGVYPHLAMTNTHDECGVGAVVPWAGKLWAITYGPHQPTGSTDKLYEIAPDLSRVIRAESIGGTPANRFIHTPSNQLIIGPHFIDGNRNVRTLSYTTLPGRYTATAAHLTDPNNRVYMFTMEDGLYDINVNDLSYKIRYPDVQGTGDAFLAGYHGKGAYTGQGLLAVGNNGEPNQTLPSGVLATWNGTTQGTGTTPDLVSWNQVERIQTCEVTGPGGIYGNPNPATDPIWTTGFDPEAVILHSLENGVWHTWRLPKASYTHDGAHGWHTEWPRIRQLDPTDPNSIYLMHMHGFHEKAVKQNLKFTSTRVFHGVRVDELRHPDRASNLPPPPLGDGRGEAPGRGFGGESGRGRVGVRTFGDGAATPQVEKSETGNRASIRTCSGQVDVWVRVHDSIQVSVWRGKGWDAAILFAHWFAFVADADSGPQSSQGERAGETSQSSQSRRAGVRPQLSRIFEVVSSWWEGVLLK